MTNFVDLYKTYFDFVWSSARYLGVDEAEMDDVVQEIFITIHGRISTLQKPESLRSWIYGITRRVVCTYHRTKRTALITTNTVRLEPEMLRPERTSPLQIVEQSEQTELLRILLNELDASKREIIQLAELHEMTAPEIAVAIDIPLNTVYSRLRAARQELEEGFRRYNARIQWRDRACAI
jgi:RNA polymerase sigma-70 factor (ECF subfamily)